MAVTAGESIIPFIGRTSQNLFLFPWTWCNTTKCSKPAIIIKQFVWREKKDLILFQVWILFLRQINDI